MDETAPNYFQELRQLIDSSYNLSEIQSLCLDLKLDYEHLAGDEKIGKINALLLYTAHKGRINDLLSELRTQRERVEWPDIPPETKLLEDKDAFALDSGLLTPGDVYLEKGKKLLWGIIGLSFVILIILFVLLFSIRPDLPVRLGLMAPNPMPPGLNVVVAGFGREQNGQIVANDETADTMNEIISAALKEMTIVDNVRDRNDPGVDYIMGKSAGMREMQADQLAKTHNADIVIYGIVTDLGFQTKFVPEFYIAPVFAATQPELISSDIFGEPLIIIEGWDESDALSERIEILKLFLNGLVAFISEEYDKAQQYFEEGATKHPQPGLEVLYILAGNAASRRNEFEDAFSLYSQSLQTRPNYARGFLGRGSGFFQIAGQIRRATNPEYNPNLHLPEGTTCLDEIPLEQVELLIEMAETCYLEAAMSSDQPPTSDIDIKVPYQLGLLYSWRSQFEFGDYWEETKQSMEEVLELYAVADEAKQARLLVQAARAHETLANRLATLQCDDPVAIEQAIDHYTDAIDLQEQNVNQARASRRIEFIQSQIDNLESDPCK